MKKYKLIKDITIYDRGTHLKEKRFSFENTEATLYTIRQDKDSVYIEADRTELGKWLIKHNLLEEV